MEEHSAALTPTEYINHHLTYREVPFFGGTLHLDTVIVGLVLGILALWLLGRAARKATSGVPGKWQAAVEVLLDFVDDQIKSVFPGERSFVGPLALTVFVWALLMNAMDLLPVDPMAWVYHNVFRQPAWRHVATADVNTTFALSLSVFGLMVFFHIKTKGLWGWIRELFTSPFGGNPLLWPLNLLFNAVEYISKPLSHSLRLYGNMYAGEIIFLLLGMWAATGAVGAIAGVFLGVAWSIFDTLIIVIQAFIFMMLTGAYIAMAHEHH